MNAGISLFAERPLEKLADARSSNLGGDAVASLARDAILQGLDIAQLESLARITQSSRAIADLPIERWAVIGGYTTHPVSLALRAALLALGRRAEIYESEFDALRAGLLAPAHPVYEFEPSHVLFCIGHKDLENAETGAHADETNRRIDSTYELLEHRWKLLQKKCGAKIHTHNIDAPPHSLGNRFAREYSWNESNAANAFNSQLTDAAKTGIDVVDVRSLQDDIGAKNWFSPKWYATAKLGFDPRWIAQYSRFLYTHLAAQFGCSLKAIVLDLDNTLWKGIIGESGWDGVSLGAGTPEGEGHADFCRHLKSLSNSGVLLAVATNNEPARAREIFDKHPAMPLAISDFVGFEAVWSFKAESVRSIAAKANIRIRDLAFLDDSKAECEAVKQAFPEAVVLHAGEDPTSFSGDLARLNLFERSATTQEDLHRNTSVQALNAAADFEKAALDRPAFLRNLEMSSRVREPIDGEFPRVSQLFAKTNQFNFNQQSFDEQQLRAPERSCLVCDLQDRFTHHGLVSAIVFQIDKCKQGEARIMNWVMSCRVFNRTLEAFFLNALVELLCHRDIKRVSGDVLTSGRNGYALSSIQKLDLDCEEIGVKAMAYSIDVAAYEPLETYVERSETR